MREAISCNGACLSGCIHCRPQNWRGADEDRPGVALADAIEREAFHGDIDLEILRDVRRLSQCKRPCVVAFSSADRFTYLFGDLDPARDTAAVCDAFELHVSRPDGFMERVERPDAMANGILARIPPLTVGARNVEARPKGRPAASILSF